MADVIVDGEDVARFIGDRLGVGICPPFYALGTRRDGVIIHGVLFNQYEGANIHVSAAGSHWTRTFLRAVGHYVFGDLGCCRATLITEQPAVADLALRCGALCEGRMRDYFGPGRDAALFGVLASEYRFF